VIIDLAAHDLDELFNQMWSEIVVEVEMRKSLG
jgi:hypothetical protein